MIRKRLISILTIPSLLGVYGLAHFQLSQIPHKDTTSLIQIQPAEINLPIPPLKTSQGTLLKRTFSKRLPAELLTIKHTPKKKDLFIKTLTPLILKSNETIQKDRERLKKIKQQNSTNQIINSVDEVWVLDLANQHRLDVASQSFPNLVDTLLFHHDIYPPALIMAQAIIESGWGTSRFSQEGNALFGLWVWGDEVGMLPRDRNEGDTHRIKAYKTLQASVDDYILNLNRHPAYSDLRQLRFQLKQANAKMTGENLAKKLNTYSEMGSDYVDYITTVMEHNNLTRINALKLEPVAQ